MKAYVASAILAGIALTSTAALAASQTKAGEIKSTDAAKHEFTLASGETFQASSHVNLAKLSVGEKVTIIYETKEGKMVASKVRPAK